MPVADSHDASAPGVTGAMGTGVTGARALSALAPFFQPPPTYMPPYGVFPPGVGPQPVPMLLEDIPVPEEPPAELDAALLKQPLPTQSILKKSLPLPSTIYLPLPSTFYLPLPFTNYI